LNILLATTEAVPFAKTGGLADVCGALPQELASLGHNPVVIMPAFRQIFDSGEPIEPTGVEFDIQLGSKTMHGRLLRSCLPGSNVPVFFVQQDHYFNRKELYREADQDYRDNCERFIFFCRAVMESIRLLELEIDILHANDWPTGLLPAYLKAEYRDRPEYENIASLMTVHNLSYQGLFWHWDMELTGLDWKFFNWKQMEFFGQLNLLKTGLAFADAINTVSPRYAEEIQSAPLGCGLEGMLSHRRETLSGIINGIDCLVWDPATDKHLAKNYDANSFAAGKAVCKAALQKELGLPEVADVPVIGFIGRLTDQKGCDLIAQVMQEWMQSSPAQWVLLGTGEPQYHVLFSTLAERHPQKVAAKLQFSDALAHRIEAGSDLFLMPSQYEPCGLNQLYSLRYGTVPVVRSTGGLADTITNATSESILSRNANGFSFSDYSALALSETLARATAAYADKKLWSQLIETGMRQDWSWKQSAQQYVKLYEKTYARAHKNVFA
jgi:starch synthase